MKRRLFGFVFGLALITTMNTAAYAAEPAHFAADGAVNEANVTRANELMDLLPLEVTEALSEGEWTLVVTDENLVVRYLGELGQNEERLQELTSGKYSGISGLTSSKEKTVWITNTMPCVNQSVLHEVGHAVDFEEQRVFSRSDLWTEVFETEKEAFQAGVPMITDHDISSTQEGFASAWSAYWLYGERFQAAAPQMYAYIEGAVLSFTGADTVSDLTFAGTEDFSIGAYYHNYPDLREAYGYDPDALYSHFVRCGQAEGRNALTLQE